jgi:hypothetical protein
MGVMSNDPVIDEVRAARHQISERVDHDTTRLVAYYMEIQERYRGRLIHSGLAEDSPTKASLTHGCSGPAARAAERGR